MWVSGRMTVRLIADGALSFAFVPILMLLSLLVVYAWGPRAIRFANAADLFFAMNLWQVWLVAFMALRCFLTPIQAGAPPLAVLLSVVGSFVLTAVVSAVRDFKFFRHTLQQPAARAARDLIAQRLIAWSLAIIWFDGPAIRPFLEGLR